MKNIQVFEIALGLGKPWYIESINLDADRNRLDIRVNFTRGAKEALIKEEEEYVNFSYCVEIVR